MKEKLLTEREAANYLAMSHVTLRRWRSQGLGPRYLRVGQRSIRYRPDDLNGFLEEMPTQDAA